MFDPDLTPEQLDSYRQQMAACREWLQQYDHNQHTIPQLTGVLEMYIKAYLLYYTNLPGVQKDKQIRTNMLEDKLNATFFLRTRDFMSAMAASKEQLPLLHAEIARYDHAFVYYRNGIYTNLAQNEASLVDIYIKNVFGSVNEGDAPGFDIILDNDGNFNHHTGGAVFFYFFADVIYLEWLRRLEAEIAKWEGATETVKPKLISNPIAKKGPRPSIESFEQMFWEPTDAEIAIRVMNRLRLLEEDETFIAVKNNKKALAILLDFLGKRKNQKLRPVADNVKAGLLSERFKFRISDRALRGLYKDSEAIMSEIERLWQEESVKVAS